MTYFIETENSTYVLDDEEMTWERVKVSGQSGYLRTDGGQLTTFPKIKVGEPLTMLGPPIVEDATARLIYTTPVTKVCTYADGKIEVTACGT